MSYQLPQELRTRKLDSLPEKERSIAEQLIADKFGIGEIVGAGVGYDPLDPAQDIGRPRNLITVTLSFGTGKVYRLARIISLSSQQLSSFEYEYGSGFQQHPIFIHLAKDIANEIEKLPRKINYNSIVRSVEVEMNGYRETITTIESLAQFMYAHYQHEELRYYGVS